MQASKKGKGLKFVRINAGPMGADDLEVVVSSPSRPHCRDCEAPPRPALLTRFPISYQLKSKYLDGIVIPKVDSAAEVQAVDALINLHGLEKTKASLRIIASIESPLALMNLKEVRPPFSRAIQPVLTTSMQIATSSQRLDSLLVRPPPLPVYPADPLHPVRIRRLLRYFEPPAYALPARDGLRSLGDRGACEGVRAAGD